MKILVNTTATINLNHQWIDVPIKFEAETQSTDMMTIRHEIYHLLKGASVGFGEYTWKEIKSK